MGREGGCLGGQARRRRGGRGRKGKREKQEEAEEVRTARRDPRGGRETRGEGEASCRSPGQQTSSDPAGGSTRLN